MTSKATFHSLPNGGHVEVGTITHEGRDFSSGGSVVDPISGRAVLYAVERDGRTILTSWDGALTYPAAFGAWHRAGFGHWTKRRSVRATILGQAWHGWAWNTHGIVRLRASVAAQAKGR